MPVARRIGAINTIRVDDGRWIGGNTDASRVPGAAAGARVARRAARVGARRRRRGAGGGRRARVERLRACGSTRATATQAEEVADAARRSSVGPWPPRAGQLGPADQLHADRHVSARRRDADRRRAQLTGQYVYDLVYNPPITRLLREAAAAGCQTIGGLDMLVAQAREQFQWWTGTTPPAGVMREAALEAAGGVCAR